jgi:N-acetyl-1-D-myo-inositol-2-amino-2-deoxy-alpha-D-glucopyranoside deacetylase
VDSGQASVRVEQTRQPDEDRHVRDDDTTRTGGLLAVHPHPDDESIACGGVLALTAAAGLPVHVVTCTGGEAGENLAGIDLGDEDLASHRRRELADALAALGVRDHTWLGYRDSGMVGTPENDDPECFHRADLYEAAARLARLVRRLRPDVLVSDDAQGTYGHPDHVKAHRVTERALTLAADPWWETPEDGPAFTVPKRYTHVLSRGRLLAAHRRLLDEGLASPFGEADATEADIPFGVDDEEVTTVVDISRHLEDKRAAMAAHRSQMGPDSFFLNLPDDLARTLFGTEEFVLTHGVAVPGRDGREPSLFAGLDRTARSDSRLDPS